MSSQNGEPLIVASLRVPYQTAVTYILDHLREQYADLRPAQLIIFQVIEHPPAGSRLTDLAEQAQITVQSMGELIDALERHGYVAREADPNDRRAKRIYLTDRGWAVHERAGEIVRDLHKDWAHRLGAAKFDQLLALLRDLNNELS